VLELSIFGYIVFATWVLQVLACDEAQNAPVAWQEAALIFGVAWLWPLSLPLGYRALAREEQEVIKWRVTIDEFNRAPAVEVQKPKKRKGKKK
jgi:hypothetical protein